MLRCDRWLLLGREPDARQASRLENLPHLSTHETVEPATVAPLRTGDSAEYRVSPIARRRPRCRAARVPLRDRGRRSTHVNTVPATPVRAHVRHPVQRPLLASRGGSANEAAHRGRRGSPTAALRQTSRTGRAMNGPLRRTASISAQRERDTTLRARGGQSGPGPRQLHTRTDARSLLDLPGVAERLCVGQRHVRRLVAERRIPFIKWGHLLRSDPDEVDAWLDAARVPPNNRFH